MTISPEDLRQRVRAIFPELQVELENLVRIPSVSAPAFDQNEVARSAEAVAALVLAAGVTDVRVATVPGGRPAVLARIPAPQDAPTVLLYAHHDVQPPGAPQAWETEAFEPVQRGERLYGRGAADDKAGIIAHIGALRALGSDLGVGVTLFFEGEEEIGSPTFVEFLHAHREELRADVIVVADSANWKVGVPALTTRLRGLVTLDVTVRVGSHAVHSGMFGGPVLDALTVLSRLISTLHDDDGQLQVAGLHTGPDPEVDYTEVEFRADAGVLDGVRLAGNGPIAARLWSRPALNVIGIDAPSVAASSNTIQPVATARLSLRIPPGETTTNAEDSLKAHLLANAPLGAVVEVARAENNGQPFESPKDSSAMVAVRSAMADAWGVPPVDIGIGGSIPFIADLLEVYPDAAILVTGVEDPDSRAHGANESVHLGELEKAVLAEALFLSRLG